MDKKGSAGPERSLAIASSSVSLSVIGGELNGEDGGDAVEEESAGSELTGSSMAPVDVAAALAAIAASLRMRD